MDETDVVLSLLLLQNSRTPYSGLADKLSMSVPSVHKRIQALREAGIIRAFTANISLFALKGLHVLIFGRSDAQSPDEVPERLRRNNSIYWVALAGGNYLYVGAYLHSISELESCVDFVRKGAKMPDPTVGVVQVESPIQKRSGGESTLARLDYQIVRSLHKDSRKSISDVAEEIGVSSKTAGRRLERMIANNLVEMSMEWYPDASNDIMTVFHFHLKADADRGKAAAALINKYSPQALFLWSFSNLPNVLLSVVWSNSMKELRDIRTRFQREPFIESVVPNVLYTGYLFETWRDRLLDERSESK